VLGQLRQIGSIEVDGDRDALLCGSELGADLVMKQIGEIWYRVSSRQS
jgi:hypothetical protein